jgi:uncharacterized membrane protein (UPF0127 family)
LAPIRAIREAGTGREICRRCELAETFWARLRGLQMRRPLEAGEGLLLRPAASIHMFFVRFPIDAVFLDEELTVVKVSEALRPWRLASCRRAQAVLELPAGDAQRAGLSAGVRVELAPGRA